MPKATLLIIDKDEDYRASTRALPEGEGYEVREASSGGDGLDSARAQRPHLIVLDIPKFLERVRWMPGD